MKLTPSDRLIQLAMRAMEVEIIPYLQGSSAKGSADLVRLCLSEMLRRERVSADVLHTKIAEGKDIARSMRSALGEPAPAESAQSSTAAEPLSESFPEYDALMGELVGLCSKLRSADDPTADATALIQRAANWEYDTHHELGKDDEDQPPLAASGSDAVTRDLAQDFVRSVHPDGAGVSVVEFDRLYGGLGKQTYMMKLREADGRDRDVVIRGMDPEPIFWLNAFSVENEFVLLDELHKQGLKVAKPLWLAKDYPGAQANFIITERLPGRPPGTFFSAEKLDPALILDIAANLAQLHSLDIRKLEKYIDHCDDPVVLTETVTECCRRTITKWREHYFDGGHLLSPSIFYLFDHALNNLPEDDRQPALVHADFNLHNMLMENDRITGVLDWEGAMFGAPEQDLAWIRNRIAEHLPWDDFIAHYVACGGRPPRLETLDFYDAFASVFSLVGISRASRNMQCGATDDLRLLRVELQFWPAILNMGLKGAQAN